MLIDLRDYADDKIQIGKQKFIPTDDELKHTTRFADNILLKNIEQHPQVKPYLNSKSYSWKESNELLKKIWDELKALDFYKTYAQSEENDFNSDKQFIIEILQTLFVDNAELDAIIEEKNIYWNDDLEFILSILISTIKKMKKQGSEDRNLVSLYKDEEDKEFAYNLLKHSLLNHTENDETITKYLKNWELDRIAMIDRLILHLALTEFNYMPKIPIKVTINEYLDIAKCYSTERSNVFINGVLDRVYNDLKSSGKLNKSGRGLLTDTK